MLAVTVRVVEGTETGPVFYEVNHQRDGRAWVARERYSALSAMADALRAENAELPEMRFPPKLWSRMLAVWRDPCTPALPPDEMEERRSGLQAYLSALSELKGSWSSDTVTRVLCSQQAGSSADPAAAIEVKALVSDPQSGPQAVDTQEQQQQQQQQPAAEAEAASALLSLSSSPPNRPGVDSAFSTGVASAVAGSSTPDVVAVRTGHKEGGQKQAAVAAGTATATTADVVKPRGGAVTENRASAAAVSKVTNASAPAPASAATKTKTRGRDAPPYSPIAVSSTEDVAVPSMPASAFVTSTGNTVAGTTTDGTNQEAEKTASSSSSSSSSRDVSRGGRLLSAVIADVDRVAAQQENAGAFVPVPTSSLVLPAAFDTKVPYETKPSTGGDDEFARDREVASEVSALALSSATEGDENEEHGGISSRVSLSSENSIAETPSATKRRTSLLGRAKRSLSSKKPGGKNKSSRVPANIVGDENPTGAPSNAPVTPGSRASGLGRLSSFRDKARSLKGRLSGGGSGGGGGPLSLNSARGAGKGFFSMSGTTPEEGDGTAAATAVSVAAAKSVATKDAERTQSMAATVSPASPASPSLDGLEAIPKVTEELFMAVGNSKGGSVSFATPPSPGGD